MADTAGANQWRGADAYEAFMGRWSRPVAEAALTWLRPAPDRAWLDVGCGTGALTTAILASANPREVLGIDPSSDFLATATTNVSDARVRFAEGDAAALPTLGDHFDVVIAGLVLHFVPDPLAATREMARAARPGGDVVAYVWDAANPEQFTGFLWKAALALDPASEAHFPPLNTALCQPEPLTALYTGAGLHDVTVEQLVVPALFCDFDDYWQPLLLAGTSPPQRYIATLSPDDRSALREQLRATLPIAADGSIPLRGYVWVVRGTK